ncbi:MAG: AtpZ/AtpI family protein [Deltaproteobacteria bacterium]|nr:AtpZ/AtpI family protein [Deltaproteobacteria bacterium]
MKKEDYKAIMQNLTLVTQLGLTMVGCILFCGAIGYYIDKWLGIKGPFTVVFLILGVIGGAYTGYRQIKEVLDIDKDDSTRNGK